MRFTVADKKQFETDGYLLVRQLFSTEEMTCLAQTLKGDAVYTGNESGNTDASGKTSKLRLRSLLEDDIASAFVASHRLVDNVEILLEDEPYHYHHKVMQKEPQVGGAWEWHQDYGYWYDQDCLAPDMISCAISIDPSTKENGCLQLLKGSHSYGRIDHGTVGTQAGADLERVAALEERLELVYATMEPGDVLFFHGNTLHRSNDNRSDMPRWLLIGCYNAKKNEPYKDAGHMAYARIERIEDADLQIVSRKYRLSNS